MFLGNLNCGSIGEVTLAKTEVKGDATPITVSGKKGGNKNGGDKAPKEKKEKAKKEAAPKKEKKAKEVNEEDEPPKPKPKEKHLFQIMDAEKPSPFVMDEWKRTYSNARDYEKCMETFWSMYDKDGWSIYRGDYKYNEENVKLFMTCNLIGGFIQRTEEIRKWLFGTMTIRGKEGEFMKVSCYYLIRGQDIQPLITANDDAAYYDWKKLPEVISDEEKKNIFDYWCSDGPLDGEVCLDSRVYK